MTGFQGHCNVGGVLNTLLSSWLGNKTPRLEISGMSDYHACLSVNGTFHKGAARYGAMQMREKSRAEVGHRLGSSHCCYASTILADSQLLSAGNIMTVSAASIRFDRLLADPVFL
ncbi:hypothetical protein MAPG_09476 [Magnaporthiopsis poae ATCC 64411]|uniref:Uncharacterized protein n=1 Tax=Magnaporthiopsis poae (strain ATCC 64411 / 73-15) TaxID=644358 RepID=A0A0C4EA22_MAGP6|nr:hypothetical protein MAPG_09476 [Magnaporthiopsis poae ATCC 64411]